ncbi:MAG TPA: hypothetical protein VH309_03595 [Elusimicrobiota bacterium]|nr:hypothetical protein [Elusimicrobiota bacterium]
MFFLHFLLAAALSAPAQAAPSEGLVPTLSTSVVVPTYVTLAPMIHDYTRFADGGPDANWYIGFNNAWIVKLPPAPAGEFQRAFIGAKVGRAKTRPNTDKPWIREIIPGKVYIGISQTPSWSSEQSFFLAETSDIPADADQQARVDGIGAAEWFWAEVPTSMVSSTQPNYLIAWSPTNAFTDDSVSPILAAAELDEAGSRDAQAWNNRSILGVPPRSAVGALETPITNIVPALAIKLVPPAPDEPAVSVNDLTLARSGKRVLVRFSAAGEDVTDAWVEMSRDRLDWDRISKLQRRPPYIFALPADKTPEPGQYVRGVARDISGAVGYSDPEMIPYAPQP